LETLCGFSGFAFRWIERSVARCFIVAASPHFFWHRAAERSIHHADFPHPRFLAARGLCALIAKLAQSIFAP
jgi:hypothetical protein